MTRGKEKSGNISIFGGMSHVISIRFACLSTDMPNKRTVVLSALRHIGKYATKKRHDGNIERSSSSSVRTRIVLRDGVLTNATHDQESARQRGAIISTQR